MTDHDSFDDLASAHLDGVTTPEEAARVAADPQLLGRVEALRAVRAAVASVPAADPDRRDQAIAAALAAYDADTHAGNRDDTLAPVRELTPVTARRTGSSRSWRIAGVAAAVAVVAVLVPLLASLSSDSDDDSQTEAAALDRSQPEAEDSGAADTLPGAGELEEGGPTSTTAGALYSLPLGTFDDDDALVAVARSASSTNSAMGFLAPTVAADASTCLDDLLAALPPEAEILLTATASLSGEPVDVVVTRDEVRIAGGDCSDLLIRPR